MFCVKDCIDSILTIGIITSVYLPLKVTPCSYMKLEWSILTSKCTSNCCWSSSSTHESRVFYFYPWITCVLISQSMDSLSSSEDLLFCFRHAFSLQNKYSAFPSWIQNKICIITSIFHWIIIVFSIVFFFVV